MRKLGVFVHLAHSLDAERWHRNWEDGSLVGINDPTPYGYERANSMGCEVRYSKGKPENPAQKLLRLVPRAILGFDIVHAWRNRRDIMASQVVWTHTESQALAVAAILAWTKAERRPRLIGQTIWLFDEWPKSSFLRKALYRRLIPHIDIVTVHSPKNLAVARTLFPGSRCEMVKFGIPTEHCEEPSVAPGNPLRILCVGNDRHRDWKTVVAAVDGHSDRKLTIISQTADPALVRGMPNAEIRQVGSNDELLAAYRNADVLVMPLRPNLHASGLTVIQEAALMGVPVIATDTGGLDSYFDAAQLRYVPPFDADAISAALSWIASHPRDAQIQAERAQAQMRSGALGCARFIERHVELSMELLETQATPEPTAQSATGDRDGLPAGATPAEGNGQL